MSWNTLTVSKDGPIAVVRMNRPDSLNAFNRDLLLDMTDCARRFQEDHDTHAVILTGAGRAFSAGADMKEGSAESGLARQRYRSKFGRNMAAAWEAMPQTTIAAIEGFAIGGGVVIATCCDWRVMAEDAYLHVPEIALGMNLQWQAIPRLVALVGPARAKRIVMLCERMEAAKALDWGLAEEVTPKGGALDKAMELAKAACAMPPVVMTMTKETINATANANLHAASVMDSDQFLLVNGSEEAEAARQKFRNR